MVTDNFGMTSFSFGFSYCWMGGKKWLKSKICSLLLFSGQLDSAVSLFALWLVCGQPHSGMACAADALAGCVLPGAYFSHAAAAAALGLGLITYNDDLVDFGNEVAMATVCTSSFSSRLGTHHYAAIKPTTTADPTVIRLFLLSHRHSCAAARSCVRVRVRVWAQLQFHIEYHVQCNSGWTINWPSDLTDWY